MDIELLQQRIDYFIDLGYITYESLDKQHHLMASSFLLVMKIFSMKCGFSFPKVNANNIRKLEFPVLYVTDLGEKIFVKYLQALSTELFELIAPIFKGQFTPTTFVLSNPRLLQNIRGTVGDTTRKNAAKSKTFHVFVNNSAPFEYLQAEYVFDNIYETRTFINKLLAYVPEKRLELYRYRVDIATGYDRKDMLELTTARGLYKT